MAKATKETPEKPARKPRAKQGHLPEMEPPSIPEIDEAAELLADMRGNRMAYLKKETEAADALLVLMTKHKLTVYEFDNKRVEVDNLRKIKVKKRKSDDESNGDDSED